MRGSASLEVEDRLFRALAVLRLVLLANTVALTIYRWQNFDHPRAGALVVAVLTVWTALILWWTIDGGRRRDWMLALDLALAAGSMLLTPLIKGNFNATIPGFWVAGPLLACAIRWRAWGGFAAGVLLGVCDFMIRDDFTESNYGNVFLLVVGGVVVGQMSGSIQEMAEQRATAVRLAAAASERARLARAVHDGVLQVLALVQRRSGEPDADFVELGHLAAEQEATLRALIRQQDNIAGPPGGVTARPEPASADLTQALERLNSGHVTVVTPGGELRLPQHVVGELLAATGEALANVDKHVGAQAPAWVLLEATGAAVTVSIRDEGPGIPDGRLAAARDEGRLGVVGSIVGRLADLGGTATLETSPHGTEWELTVPLGSMRP